MDRMKEFTNLFFSIVIIFMLSLTMLANTSVDSMGKTIVYILVVIFALSGIRFVSFRRRVRH